MMLYKQILRKNYLKSHTNLKLQPADFAQDVNLKEKRNLFFYLSVEASNFLFSILFNFYSF